MKKRVLTKQEITLKYLDSIVIDTKNVTSGTNDEVITNTVGEIMKLGYLPNEDMVNALHHIPTDGHEAIISSLRKFRGTDVVYEPMYPNFPQQVINASDSELFINAILHYWTFGEWKPEYEKEPREVDIEATKFTKLGVVNEEDFQNIFVQLLSVNESISEGDKATIEWFINHYKDLPDIPEEIPYKENLCYVASLLLEKGKDISSLVKTSTDVLRIATALSDGDISLAENTKFKSFPRKTRKILCDALAKVGRKEDIQRHRNKWIRLFHCLHVGEHSTKLRKLADPFRKGQRIETFNSRLEHAIAISDVSGAVELLGQRPGEFARRLDHLLRLGSRKRTSTTNAFLNVVDQVPTRILLQLLGNLKVRGVPNDYRVVFPKGQTQKAIIVPGEIKGFGLQTLIKLRKGIEESLEKRFSELGDMGKVWIDPELDHCPIPTQQRSASEALYQVARGSRLPIGDKGTLRFFIYWIGRDIDLSATFHDENFYMIDRVSYTQLKSDKYKAYHSGDITRAPNGASEFIDIDINSAVKYGARYVAMNVLVYFGPTFKEHETVYAGWMTREKPKSNEIYDPKTVTQKCDLVSNASNAIPVIFDLVERRAIWTDLVTKRNVRWHNFDFFGRRASTFGNNVEANRASIEETIKAITSIENKVTLYGLFELHANARGEIVENREEADVTFGIDGDITPWSIITINSDFIK